MDIDVGDYVVDATDEFGDVMMVSNINSNGVALCYDTYGYSYLIEVGDLEQV